MKAMPKPRKILNNWQAPYIQSLMRLIETQSKATLAYWAVECSQKMLLPLWYKQYPEDPRPENALNAALAWLSGAVKLPLAKAVILECHAAARASRRQGHRPMRLDHPFGAALHWACFLRSAGNRVRSAWDGRAVERS